MIWVCAETDCGRFWSTKSQPQTEEPAAGNSRGLFNWYWHCMVMKNPAATTSFNEVCASVLPANISHTCQISGLNMVGNLFPWPPPVWKLPNLRAAFKCVNSRKASVVVGSSVCHKECETNLKRTLLLVKLDQPLYQSLDYQLSIAVWIQDQLSSVGSNPKVCIPCWFLTVSSKLPPEMKVSNP